MGFEDSYMQLLQRLPGIKEPIKKLSFREKLKYTGMVLLVFFLMSQIMVWGIRVEGLQQLKVFELLLASKFGSMTTLGIGPIVVAAIILHWSPFASRRQYEGLLRFSLPASPTMEDQVRHVLHQCCSAFYLIALREAVQGDVIEYSYQVKLLDPSYQADLVDRLHEIEEVSDANLLMQRTTVEL